MVGNETYPVGGTDFTSVLTQFKQEQPDLLIAEQTSEQATAILQQAVQLGVAPYALNDVATPDQIQKVPGIEKMTVFISNFSPTFSPNATIPDYHPEEIFGDQQPAGNPGAAINMYYVTYMLKQAMEQAGTTTDSAKIAAALPGQSYDGPFGTCEMTERQAVDCETTSTWSRATRSPCTDSPVRKRKSRATPTSVAVEPARPSRSTGHALRRRG